MTVEARTVAFYNFRQILKFLVYYLPQLSFITGSSISDLFDRASHKIAVRRVWRPHIRRSMVNEIILDYWVVLTVCAGAESCWNTCRQLLWPKAWRQNVSVHILVQSQPLFKDVWRHNISATAHYTEDHYVERKLCFHYSGYIFGTISQPSVVLTAESLILAKVFPVRRKSQHVCLQKMFNFVQKFLAL